MVALGHSHVATNGAESTQQNRTPNQYSITEAPIYQTRPIRVLCIGAGISGLALLYKFKGVENVTVTVLEKSEEVGGVWLDNKYPGCSCDIPAHIYTYSFAGNPNWSR